MTPAQAIHARGMQTSARIAGESIRINGRKVVAIVERDVEQLEMTEAGQELVLVNKLTIAFGALRTPLEQREVIDWDGDSWQVASITTQPWATTYTLRRAK